MEDLQLNLKTTNCESCTCIKTRFQLMVPFGSQRPPNFKVVIGWQKIASHLISCISTACCDLMQKLYHPIISIDIILLLLNSF